MHNILSVDARGISGLVLSGILTNLPIRICNATGPKDAFGMLEESKEGFELVVWTADISNMEVFTEIECFTLSHKDLKIPLFIMSELEGREYYNKAIKCGAERVFQTPYDNDEIRREIASVLGIKLPDSIKDKMNQGYVTYSLTDHFNRQLKAAGRGDYPISILLIEMHPTGNAKVTQALASVLHSRLRLTDTVFQASDNSIIALLPFADKSGCETVIEKITEIIESHSALSDLSNNKISMAYATFPDDGKTQDRLLKELENRLAGL